MDSTFARQCDDVSSTLSLRANTLNGAIETVSPPRNAPSSFLLALVPTALKQLLADAQQANLVVSPQTEMPDGWSQFDALLAAAPSPSTHQSEVASRLALGRTVTSGLVSSGAIESVKIGARRLIPVGAVADFVERLRAEQLRSELSDVNG